MHRTGNHEEASTVAVAGEWLHVLERAGVDAGAQRAIEEQRARTAAFRVSPEGKALYRLLDARDKAMDMLYRQQATPLANVLEQAHVLAVLQRRLDAIGALLEDHEGPDWTARALDALDWYGEPRPATPSAHAAAHSPAPATSQCPSPVRVVRRRARRSPAAAVIDALERRVNDRDSATEMWAAAVLYVKSAAAPNAPVGLRLIVDYVTDQSSEVVTGLLIEGQRGALMKARFTRLVRQRAKERAAVREGSVRLSPTGDH